MQTWSHFSGLMRARPPRPPPPAAKAQPGADQMLMIGGDVLPGQLLRHLHRLADTGVQRAAGGGLNRVVVLVGLPPVERHGHAAPGDAQVLQVVLNLGSVGRALDAEIAAHAVILAAGPRRVHHEPGGRFVNFTRGFDRESGANYLSVGEVSRG